jgi:hypothetical protein
VNLQFDRLRCSLETKAAPVVIALISLAVAPGIQYLLRSKPLELFKDFLSGIALSLGAGMLVILLSPPAPAAICKLAPLTEAQVRFTNLSGQPPQQLPAGGVLSLHPGEGIRLETQVLIEETPYSDELSYSYFAPAGRFPEADGGPRANYIPPSEPGPDIITVSIRDPETNEEIVRSLSVQVTARPP